MQWANLWLSEVNLACFHVTRCFQSYKAFHNFWSDKTANSANILYLCIYKSPESLLSIYSIYSSYLKIKAK